MKHQNNTTAWYKVRFKLFANAANGEFILETSTKKGAFCLYSQLKFLSRHAECKQIEVPVRGSISMSGGCEGMRVWRGIVSFDGHKLPVG